MNSREEEFDEARRAALVAGHTELSGAEWRDLILAEVVTLAGETPPHDDTTVVVARVVWNRNWERR